MSIIANKIVTPDGTLLQSFTRHDYKEYKDLNGKIYGIDGGVAYQRIIGDIKDLEIILITDEDDFETIRTEMYWGTYGKNGTDNFKWVYLNEMSDDHIQAIIETQVLPEWKSKLFKKELQYRKDNNISIKDLEKLGIKPTKYQKEILQKVTYDYPTIHIILSNITKIVKLDGSDYTDGECIDILWEYLKELNYIKEDE